MFETCSSPVSSFLGHLPRTPFSTHNFKIFLNCDLRSDSLALGVECPDAREGFLVSQEWDAAVFLQSFLVVSAHSMGSLLLIIFLDRWLCTHTRSLCDQQHCSCGYGSNMIKYGPIGPVSNWYNFLIFEYLAFHSGVWNMVRSNVGYILRYLNHQFWITFTYWI